MTSATHKRLPYSYCYPYLELARRLNADLPAQIIFKPKHEAIQKARSYRPGSVLWTDGSKWDTGKARAAVAVAPRRCCAIATGVGRDDTCDYHDLS